jgi:hypothetical protein
MTNMQGQSIGPVYPSAVTHHRTTGGFAAQIALACPVSLRYKPSSLNTAAFYPLIDGCIDMAKIDWEADRRRRMAATARREAYTDFFCDLACDRIPKKTTKPKRREQKRLAPSRGQQKATRQKARRRPTKSPPAVKHGRNTIDMREQQLEELRVQARADRAAGIIHFPARPRAQHFVVEYRQVASSLSKPGRLAARRASLSGAPPEGGRQCGYDEVSRMDESISRPVDITGQATTVPV